MVSATLPLRAWEINGSFAEPDFAGQRTDSAGVLDLDRRGGVATL
jgi:hypothetical protein